ncbi:ABC transporter ATP-binding protein [Stappia indica]|uniref:Iron(III) transport system ATP-binding protein n=1 Tax=Stappia indica TaxID=538381 RepID=A0A285SK67_9HYPH|nr:ABC transporter ATP-binding protein [Stappia indica]SOC06368.1 iron(III) transport system ATP-binding protein [Stappia indica]
MGPASLDFIGVTKRYGAVTAVDDVSFRCEAGSLTTLLGPSGCGKTTTLRMIAGLELASEGKILIDGKDVTHLSAAERDVTMVFQSYALFPHMNVLDNVMYGPRSSGIGKAQAAEMAREKLGLLGLSGFESRLPSELSGGQQQRVAVARALVLEPSILLFDEPLSNLDARLRRKVREDIRALQKDLGLTVVYVTHDQEEALAVSDEVIVMSNARIAQKASPRDLWNAPANLFVADFIGDANVVDGTIASVAGETAVLDLAGASVEAPARGLTPGPVKIAVRPDALRLAPLEAGDAGGLTGTVRTASYLGKHMEYEIETPLGELFITAPADGDEVGVGAAVRLLPKGHGIAVIPQ